MELDVRLINGSGLSKNPLKTYDTLLEQSREQSRVSHWPAFG